MGDEVVLGHATVSIRWEQQAARDHDARPARAEATCAAFCLTPPGLRCEDAHDERSVETAAPSVPRLPGCGSTAVSAFYAHPLRLVSTLGDARVNSDHGTPSR